MFVTPFIVNSFVHLISFQPSLSPNPLFFMYISLMTLIVDWSGLPSELAECLIMMNKGKNSPLPVTATTAVMRSIVFGMPMFCARHWSGGQYMYSDPIAYVNAVSSIFFVVSFVCPKYLYIIWPIFIIRLTSSSDGTFLSSVVIFLLLIVALVKNLCIHVELNSRTLIFSSLFYLSHAWTVLAAWWIIE